MNLTLLSLLNSSDSACLSSLKPPCSKPLCGDYNRISYRDTQTYFNILLDDNIRKTICRLYFNGTKKQIGLFDAAKNETKFEIVNLDELYNHAEAMRGTLDTYLSLK